MTATLFRVALLACLAIPSGAQAARSDWAAADQAQLRLLLSGADGDRIAGGIEIVLEPGWYTYWSNPGEAGVPPVFDFSGSDNVAAVEVLYPAPERHDDGTSVSLIYRDDVVLPLAVTPATAGLPVTLRVEARFGVCSSVCIPTAAGASVTLPPAAPRDPLAEARLESFQDARADGPGPRPLRHRDRRRGRRRAADRRARARIPPTSTSSRTRRPTGSSASRRSSRARPACRATGWRSTGVPRARRSAARASASSRSPAARRSRKP